MFNGVEPNDFRIRLFSPNVFFPPTTVCHVFAISDTKGSLLLMAQQSPFLDIKYITIELFVLNICFSTITA